MFGIQFHCTSAWNLLSIKNVTIFTKDGVEIYHYNNHNELKTNNVSQKEMQ